MCVVLTRHYLGKFENSLPSQVKAITYTIYACRFLARHLALLGQGKEWLAQFWDKVTEWDIGVISLCGSTRKLPYVRTATSLYPS